MAIILGAGLVVVLTAATVIPLVTIGAQPDEDPVPAEKNEKIEKWPARNTGPKNPIDELIMKEMRREYPTLAK
ncbi:MAG: hypothetical protein CMO80_06960 [Verrucomicrobiales bacterium]|nr:hypothetical protein [Verrucomicrobiales bacterium]